MKLLKNYYKILFILIMMFVINNTIVKASSSDYAIFNSGEVNILDNKNSSVTVYFKANKNINIDALEAYFPTSDSSSNITLSNLQAEFNSGETDSDIDNGLIYMLDTNGYSFTSNDIIFTATYIVNKNTLSGTYELSLNVKSLVESGSLEEESFTLTTSITVTRQTEPYSATFTKDIGVDSIDLYYTDDLENISESNASIGYAKDDNGDLDLLGHGSVNFKVNLKNGYELDEITYSPNTNYKSIIDHKNIFKLNTYSVKDITGNININIKTKERTKYNIYFIKDNNIDSIDIYYDEDFNSKNASITSIKNENGEVDLSGNGKLYLSISPKHGYIVNYPSVHGEYNSLNVVNGVNNYLYRIDGISGDLLVGVTSTKRIEINPTISGYNSNYIYTGNEIKPNIIVSSNNNVLIKGVDYNVSYSNNINSGNNTAKINITSIDTSNYIFENKTISFSIDPIIITNNNITVPSYVIHNGNALSVEPVVKVNGKTLIKNTDYTVSYENQNGNIKDYLIVNVNGKNNYCGNNKIKVLIESKYNVGNLLVPNISISKGNNNSLELNWNNQELAEEYLVFRSTDNKTFTQIKSVNINSYKDKSLEYGRTYYYKVKAKNRAKISNDSNIVSMKVIPNNVNGFKVTTVKKNSIKLVWDKVSGSGYQLQRSTDNKKWTTIKTFTSNSYLTYTNTSLTTNKLYYYRIRSYKTVSGNKVYSKYVSLKMKTSPLSPKVSVSLRDFNSLNVNVSSVSGATKYIIYRSTSKNGKYTKVGQLSSAGTYNDLNLITGKTYYYKVKACNSYNKCSTYSSIVSKKVTPNVPVFSLSLTSKGIVTITVSKVTGASGYEIYKSFTETGKYNRIKTITNNLSFNDGSLPKNTYYYKARSYRIVNNKKVYSNYSRIKSIKIK